MPDRRGQAPAKTCYSTPETRCFAWLYAGTAHGGDLGGLMLERVEAVQVAGHELQGRYQGCHPHRHREHALAGAVPMPLQEVPGTDTADDERRGEIGGEDGVEGSQI